MKTVKGSILVTFCFLLMATNLLSISPTVREWWRPIIDNVGGNMERMPVDEPVYHCGDLVYGYFMFQKQRNVTGTIKWQLVQGADERVTLYPPRTAAAPIGIISHWAEIERIPKVCAPGKYHYEGTITYPLGLGQNKHYPLRTECFEVR